LAATLSLLVATAATAQERQGRDVFATAPMPAPNQAEGIPTDLVEDGGFEAGTPNPFWNESSTNFGTPICDVPLCGTGGGTGPFAGSYWAWFGGIGGFFEQGSVSQTIQGGGTELCTLSFWLEMPVTSGNGTDFLEARIGGVTAWSILESAGPIAPYTEITQDVSALIDGTPQTLEFFSQISGLPDLTNFFVDDVALTCEAPIFSDGFESGDTSAWSSTAPP
jgi:hypothetical protein